jgi:hypothetical protein
VLRFRLGIGLSRYNVRMRGAETAKQKPPKSYRFYEALDHDRCSWTRQRPAGWRYVQYRVAPGTWETRREFWTPVTPLNIVEHGFAALFWPPDTFAQQSNRGDDRQCSQQST